MMTSLRLSIASFLMLFITFTGLAQASETNVEEEAKAVEGTAHIIEIRDFVFSPISVEVKAGDTITWTNFDIVPHTATAIDHSWDSHTSKTNQRYGYVSNHERIRFSSGNSRWKT